MHRTAVVAVFLIGLSFPTFAQDQAQSSEKDVSACESPAGNFDAAIEACTRILDAEIRASARRQALAIALRAVARQGKGDTKGAAVDLTEAIGLDESYALPRELRADLLRENDQCDLATPDYDQAIKLAPDRAALYLNRGLCRTVMNQADGARADFNQVVKLDGGNSGGFAVPALSAAARLDLAKGNLDGAVAYLDQALKLDPKRIGLYLDRGTIRGTKGENDQALADFNEAVRLDENNASGLAAIAWNLKGALQASRGELDAALKDYETAISLAPKQGALYAERAALWSRKGDNERASADYQKAIEASPDNAALYNARGDFLRGSGNYTLALADYDKAVQQQPDNPAGYGNRGLLRFFTGDFAKAADDFKRVVEAQPNPYSVLMLYLSRSRAGQKPAREELAKNATKLSKEQWPGPLVELFLGRIALQAAENAAKTADHKCEAQFYIGEWQITREAKPAALTALQAAVDSCPKDYVEYRGAVEELKRLK